MGIFFFFVMIPLWGEFHVINNIALQHKGFVAVGFSPPQIIFKKLLALFLTVVAKLGTSANSLVDKREKNVASKQTIMMTLKHNIKCVIDFVPEDWCKE